MKLYFNEPKDTTKEFAAVFEFFDDSNIENSNTLKIKGKSLSRLIEERKIHNKFSLAKVKQKNFKLLQILVFLAIIVVTIEIIYLLSKII